MIMPRWLRAEVSPGVILTWVIHLILVVGVYEHDAVLRLNPTINLDGLMALYFDYADQAAAGRVPYRDYLVEYPPVAFVLFWVPRVLAARYRFRHAFLTEMMLFDGVVIALIEARARRDGRGDTRWVASCLAWYTVFFAGFCPVPTTFFDMAPTAMAFAGAHWWSSGRRRLGGAMVGLGILTKIFPGAIVGPALTWDLGRNRSPRGRGLSAMLVTAAALMVAWLGVGGAGAIASLRYHLDRGLQIESLPAGFLLLWARLAGVPVTCRFAYGSWELPAAWGASWAAAAFPAQAAAMMLVSWRCWRARGADPMRYAGASVLAFLLFGKVLSTQYPIWLFPFIAVLGGPAGRLAKPLFALICILTAALYPWGLVIQVPSGNLLAILALCLRNLLLLGLFGLLLLAPGEARAPSEPA